MLGHPSIQRYSLALVHALLLGVDVSSENPSGADNQQETAFAGSSETVRGALCASGPVTTGTFLRELKIQSDPHGDMRS